MSFGVLIGFTDSLLDLTKITWRWVENYNQGFRILCNDIHLVKVTTRLFVADFEYHPTSSIGARSHLGPNRAKNVVDHSLVPYVLTERQRNSSRLCQPCTSVLSIITVEDDSIIFLGAHGEDYMVPSFPVTPINNDYCNHHLPITFQTLGYGKKCKKILQL